MYLEIILLLLHFTHPTVVASLKIRKRLSLKKLLPLLALFQHFWFQPLSSKCFRYRFHKKLTASAFISCYVAKSVAMLDTANNIFLKSTLPERCRWKCSHHEHCAQSFLYEQRTANSMFINWIICNVYFNKALKKLVKMKLAKMLCCSLSIDKSENWSTNELKSFKHEIYIDNMIRIRISNFCYKNVAQ